MVAALTEQKEKTALTYKAKNYNGIDLIKFLGAILIFIIHIPPFQGEVSEVGKNINFGLQQFICRLATPFYFVASGFFLFRKMSPNTLDASAAQSYCFKILRLIGIWSVLLFVGTMVHLWYLGAVVISVILLSACIRLRIQFKYMCVLACLLYTIGLLGDSYHGLIQPIISGTVFDYLFKGYQMAFESTRNGVFMGFIFVLMGASFSWYKIDMKPCTAFIGFMVSLLCMLAEVFLLQYNDIPLEYNMYVFMLPATFFLFAFACTVQLKDRPIYKRLRNIGMLIYFSHVCIDRLVSLAVRFVDKYCGTDILQYRFFVSLLSALLIAMLIEWLSHKKKMKWLNWLWS